jgi:hypothetical protein
MTRRLCLLELLPEENREGDAVRDEEWLRRGMMPWLLGPTASKGRKYLKSTIVLYCMDKTNAGTEFLCQQGGLPQCLCTEDAPVQKAVPPSWSPWRVT